MVHRRIFVLAATFLAVAAMVPAASASTQPAAGTFIEGPETITGEQFADGNLIITLTREVIFTGTYDGMGQADERIVIHKDGSTNVHILVAFTGLACGQPTTLTFLIEGQGQLDENFETGTVAGTYATLAGGQSESSIEGSGKFSGQAGVGGTYEGQVHCDDGLALG